MKLAGLLVLNTLSLLSIATSAAAQHAPIFDWRGFYAGAHSGGALALVDVDDPFGPSIFGDVVRTPGLLAGAQAGYNWQFGATVLGIEADASWADMDGTNTCFAYSGFYVSANCRAHIDALGTLTGRLGWALPFDSRTLLYGKAGLAWAHTKVDATANEAFDTPSTRSEDLTWGWTLGAGAERAIAPRWSLKAEYDLLSFGNEGLATPVSGLQTVPAPARNLVTVPSTASRFSQDIHQFKIGLNYRMGADDTSSDGAWREIFRPGGPTQTTSQTKVEAGVRYVRGWSRFQKDQQHASAPNATQSRLTYDDMTSDGAEFFGRVDASFGLMIKGIVGSGSGGGTNNMNDEDWSLGPPEHSVFIPYSNTLSDAGYDMKYAIIDVGFNWWPTPGTTLAPFVGYSYFKQDMRGFGCRQIANPRSDCRTPTPTSQLGLIDVDTWKALRIGAAAATDLTPQLQLSGDVAFLPYVKDNAFNVHLFKNERAPEWGHGRGVQIETILAYALTDALRVGVGGRYWSMWTTSGATDKGGIRPMRLAAEQAAVMVQGSYTFTTAPQPGGE
jgi:opacity protein-like surface antigen